MEVYILAIIICFVVYVGLLCLFSLVMDHQHRKAELRAKWERFELWREKEAKYGMEKSKEY